MFDQRADDRDEQQHHRRDQQEHASGRKAYAQADNAGLLAEFGAQKAEFCSDQPEEFLENVKCSACLPEPLCDQVDEWGAERGMTRSASIRRWIENGVKERWKPRKGD